MASLSRVLSVFTCLPLLYVHASNILVILSFLPRSHHFWNERIVNQLAVRGQNLTVLSIHVPEHTHKNVHYLHLDKIEDTIWNKVDFNLNDFVNPTHYQLAKMLYDYLHWTCEGSLNSSAFATIMNYPEDFKFEMVIHDINAGPCLLGVLHKFNYPPLVGISPYKNNPNLMDIVGGHNYAAYIPFLNLPYSTNMTFFQRLENLYVLGVHQLYRDLIYLPKCEKITEKVYNYSLPSLRSLEQRTVIVLLNIHPATDYAVPLPQNIIQVAGLEVDEPRPLPHDLEDFISKSRKGAVLISFGTNVDTSFFSNEKQQMIIEVVKKFPHYNFVWKFEKDLSNGSVSNLLVKKWLPQNDILAHSRTKLFISHGGGLSTHEATWHGVPMIVVPFYLDQVGNAHLSAKAGVAIHLDIEAFNTKNLHAAVHTILNDGSYSSRMKARSALFKDRPMKPIEAAIWWIEYVSRNPNAEHLRSPALDLNFWVANSNDLLIFIFALIFILNLVIYLIVNVCYKKFSNRLKSKIE